MNKKYPEFLKPYLKDAIAIPDPEALSAILGIKRREAEKVVIRTKEDLAGYKVRTVFCTKETRELEKELLNILSSYATTKNGKDKVLTLTPSLSREELQTRFKDVRESRKLEEQLGGAKIARVREIISGAAIERVSFGQSPRIAIRRRGIEAELKEIYGEFVQVEFLDSTDKARELLQKKNLILLIGEGDAEEGVLDEPGIINVDINNLSEPCEIYPEFVINSFVAKKQAIEAIITLLTEFATLKDSYLFKSILVEDLEDVLELVEKTEMGNGKAEPSFDDLIYRYEEKLNKGAERIMRSGGGVEEFKGYLEEVLVNMVDALMLTGEDRDVLRECAYDNLDSGLPFEFSRVPLQRLRQGYNRKKAERRYYKLREFAKQLERHRAQVSTAIKKIFYLDFMLAVMQFSRDFKLNMPELSEEGLGVIMGRNIFLVDEELSGGEPVVPVSYSIGKTNLGIFGATPHPVAILTGANSGGKTSLLIMLATSVILTELGLPVPAERAEIPLTPLYLYRRKMIKKTGSFEYSMRALSRIFMREGAKVVLIDELEALTEPGAMGRIMAAILNYMPKDTIAVVITHLIHELLPHISMEKVRVDGIESEGLDAAGNIIVDRQPMFSHIGSSTPELVIKKLLGRVKKKELKTVYEEIIKVLEVERGEAF
uniref:Endonuclease MutS2 n=1 Tax=Candidatus Methanophagaceae archaeon ANME-1 ERB6 TaxID=2759912 RepID=A0A7G9YSZ7_9EURY|nr:endonuclease MutS2 [Methanosarcinales archaeon ANME-1 ERB6]